ncbi:cytochrome c oxidase assembly factor Coa1 family protein [Flavobacterium aquicola]|uniref:Cytochrome oxidase complex assembly protein 1 n=1 Tax=Flavobacterium aquicola TaxID=1682742 RepID=A0A3E0EUV2_9FLAO|nr:cytochrome c oxidase assembly factor Coa1 family protein [Flavobacterium aquicola]REH01948.1 cytochrome oxidase complex assembly protein 1 [Flavobacterium aquicola]
MNDDIIAEKSFWTKKWFWITGIIVAGLILLVISNFAGDIINFGQAYADPLLCQNAIDKANKNKEVLQNFGKLEQIDKLAILEGSTVYYNDNNSVAVTVRVFGEKEKGKMDITADRTGKTWKYKSIKIRNTKKNTVIEVNN